MRRTGILSLAFFVTLLTLGCGTSPSPTSDANEKVRDAEKATIEAARAKRDEYARDMQKTLDELDAKCKVLEHRAANAEGQAKKDLEKKIEDAKAKHAVAAKKLRELKEASDDRWEKIKDGVGSAFDDLKKAVE
jgi:predicted  nucleic acid-binding Zn-ribbon protein